MSRPVLFCGDQHGQFRHIVEAAGHANCSAVVLLGDMEPARPLHLELAPLLRRKVPIWFIPGNHDADSDKFWMSVWGSELADRNIHGRVVELPDGRRLAGLGGVFRDAVWYPARSTAGGGAPVFRTMEEHTKSTPKQDRWDGTGPHRKHWGTIYPSTVDSLADLRADILVTHEAPGYHRHGFALLDDLARAMGVRWAIHGHQHDALDSSASWALQGFASFGVGMRGVSALSPDGRWDVMVPGELDDEHHFAPRERSDCQR